MTASMAEAGVVVGALNGATSALDKLVSLSRSYADTQRKLSLYPGQLAAFKSKACAVKQVLDDTPPGPEGSALHIARSELGNAVDKGLVRTLCLFPYLCRAELGFGGVHSEGARWQELPDASKTQS